MGLFDQFPYTNFHELNLTWILEALKELEHTIDQFVAINALKYADPIQWDITSQYEKNTIVIDPQTGTAYISVQPVPIGVALTNPEYWTVVFDLGSFVVRAAKNLANTYEAETTLTATVSTPAGGWLVWGDTLYRALVNITAGDSYVDGGNITHFTIEDVTGHLEDLTTTDKSNLVAAINEVLTTLTTTAGDLNDLTTTDKSNLVNAINEVLTTLTTTAGDLNDLNTTDKDNLVDAINEVLTTLTTTAGDLNDLNTTDKDNLVDAINEVNTKVDNVHGLAPVSRVVLFSDSYGLTVNGVTPFTDEIATILSGSAVTYEYYAVGSIGIVPNSAQPLGLSAYIDTYWYSQISTPETVTDVVIALGANDIPRRGSLPTYFTTLCNNLKTKFPNARILFAFIGQTYAETIADRNSTITAYKNNAKKNGCYYMNGSDYVMQDGYNLQSDEVHPNSDGANHLATMIVQNLVNDSYHYSASHMNVTVTMDDDSKTFTFNLLIYDNMANLNINTGGSVSRTFPVTFETGTFTTIPFRGSGSMYANVAIGDSTHRGSLMMTINNKKFYLRAVGAAITTSGTYEMVGFANCYMNLNN